MQKFAEKYCEITDTYFCSDLEIAATVVQGKRPDIVFLLLNDYCVMMDCRPRVSKIIMIIMITTLIFIIMVMLSQV